MGRFRRRGAAALAVLVAAGFLVVLTEQPAEARKVGNPGSGYVLRVQNGFMAVGDNEFDFQDEGRLPQCSDGKNNDSGQDSAVDAPDAQCDAGSGQPESQDDSEAEDGFQPKEPIELRNGTVNANGTVTFPAASVDFPRQYLWVDAPSPVNPFVARVDIIATHDVTGTINANTGAMDLRMRVRVAVSGGPINSGCGVGKSSPIDMNLLSTGTSPGVPYDPSTGRVTLVNKTFSVPGAEDCSVTVLFDIGINDQINDALGLPSPSGKNEARFSAQFIGTRPQQGVTASFTATPSSGVDPLLVSFNGGASTGVDRRYSWDFTNNGSFEVTNSTSATTSFTYSEGTHTARLRVTDGDGDFAETTRQIVVSANQDPTLSNVSTSTAEDTPKTLTITGTDPEHATLTYSRVTPHPGHGTATCTGAGSCTYTPSPNFHGTDTFGVRATDNLGNFDNAVVTVTVTPVNDAPVTNATSATVIEDTPGPVVLSGTDVDGNPLTFTIADAPDKGVLSGSGSTRTYTPFANETGTDTFTYRAHDGTTNGNVATGTITITAVNDAPEATDQVGDDAVQATEDQPATITLSGTDVEDGSLTFGITDQPNHGTLGGELPNLTYTPAPDFHGDDSIEFSVTDTLGASDTGTIEIDVAPVNDPPTTADVETTTSQDSSVDIEIPGEDIDTAELTFTPSATAAGGTVTCVAEVCTYTPPGGFFGTDSFTVVVSDGPATATSHVTVTVVELTSTPPVLENVLVAALEDVTRTFSIVGTDADGDPLTYSVVSSPAQGDLSCTPAGVCTFVPEPNQAGTVTATVRVTDDGGATDTATVTILVIPINDAPTIAAGQSVTVAEDGQATFDLVGEDVDDGDVPVWSVPRAPDHGSVTCDTSGHCTYTPFADFAGTDSFEVALDDGLGGRVRTTIPVSVTAVDDPPTAGTVTATVPEGGTTALQLVGSDVDGTVTFSADPGSLGTLTCDSAGSCTFAAAADATGTDTIAYTVTSGSAGATGTVVVTIVPANDAPVAGDPELTTPEDVPLEVTLTAVDPDGDALAFEVLTNPPIGTLSGTAPNLTYTPAPEASGEVSFTYRVTDPAGASDVGTVTIVVAAVDDAPVAFGGSFTTAEDTPLAIPLGGSDVEGPVTIAVASGPSHGTYAGGVYTPAPDHHGFDVIGYTVTSATDQVTEGSVTITVTPVNDAPVATDSSATTSRAVPVAIPLGASDVDGDGLTFTIVSPPSQGTLSGSGPNRTYTPAGLATGPDAFTFRVSDGTGASDTATVTITVTAGPDLATQLVVAPATYTRAGGLLGALLPNRYTNLRATLTTVDAGLPVVGQTVVFQVNGRTICSAATDADGIATCSGTGPRSAPTTYQASFAGHPGFAPSNGTGVFS